MIATTTRRRAHRRGQSLVIVLWVIGLISAAAGTAVMKSTHDVRIGRIPLAGLRAKAVAQAGVARAAELVALDDPAVDHLNDMWATGVDPQTQEQRLEDIGVGDGMFSIGVVREGLFVPGLTDEQGKLNLNTADPGAVRRLVELVGPGSGAAPDDIAAAVADWRDAPDGAHCAGTVPACHNAPFDTVDELRLVPGMTPELFTALERYVTVYGTGTVNANTAPAEVLSALGLPVLQIIQQRAAQPFSAANPPPAGLGYASDAFEAAVEAREPGFPRPERVRAVIHRSGRILAWGS
jgi:type II secretory pathway component PulK